jgi:prophage regulatory protein
MPTPISIPVSSHPMRALPVNVFLRLPQVLARVPISRSTLWRRVSEGTFPRPLKLSRRVTVWRLEDIESWMQEQK